MVTNEVERTEIEAPKQVAIAFVKAAMTAAVSAKMANRTHCLKLDKDRGILAFGSLLGASIDGGEDIPFCNIHDAFQMERFALQNLSNLLYDNFGITPALSKDETDG